MPDDPLGRQLRLVGYDIDTAARFGDGSEHCRNAGVTNGLKQADGSIVRTIRSDHCVLLVGGEAGHRRCEHLRQWGPDEPRPVAGGGFNTAYVECVVKRCDDARGRIGERAVEIKKKRRRGC